MFLALREIRHEPVRFGLIMSVIALVAYLTFFLASLAVGESPGLWHAEWAPRLAARRSGPGPPRRPGPRTGALPPRDWGS